MKPHELWNLTNDLFNEACEKVGGTGAEKEAAVLSIGCSFIARVKVIQGLRSEATRQIFKTLLEQAEKDGATLAFAP